jgi:transposase
MAVCDPDIRRMAVVISPLEFDQAKQGNRQTRSMLYEAALPMLKRNGKETSLGKWGAKLEHRMGLRKAVVALARKLATVLLSMWRSGKQFRCA